MLKREEAIEKISDVIRTLEIYDDDWHNEIKRLKEAIEFLELLLSLILQLLMQLLFLQQDLKH